MMKNLLNPLKALSLVVVFAGMTLITSCGGDDTTDPAPTQSLMEIIKADANYSDFLTFYEANQASLPDITGTTEYTVFVPNNDAFASLKATLAVDDLTTIKADVITAVLGFHFVAGTTAELPNGGTLTSAQGEDIHINADGTILDGGSNDAVEVIGSTKATNGIIYETGTILIPPMLYGQIKDYLGKTAQPIFLGGSFSVLAQIVAKADTYASTTNGAAPMISALLSGTDNFTVFAPTDATFMAAAGVTSDDTDAAAAAKIQGFIDNYTAQQFYGILANHVVPGNVLEADLTTGATLKTMLTADGVNFNMLQVFNNTAAIPAKNGVGIYLDSNGDVNMSDPTTYVNFDAEVAVIPSTSNGLVTSNGSLYVIAGLLLPPM